MLVTTIWFAFVFVVGGNVADVCRNVPSELRVIAGSTNGFAEVYGVVIVMVPGFTVTWMFCVSEQLEPVLLQTGAAATVITTAFDAGETAYALLVGVNTAVMLSDPTGSDVVVSTAVPVAGEAVVPLPLTVVATGEPKADPPLKNWTEPASPAVVVVLSAALTVAVSVSDCPAVILVELADRDVDVAICWGWTSTTCAEEVDPPIIVV